MAAINNHKDIVVVTKNMQIYSQLEGLKDFYPREFEKRKFSIREDFKEKYSIDIPEYISEQDLSEDHTYLELDFSSGESFENTVLRKYFDGFFIGNKFPFHLLPELCANLKLSEVKNKERVILRKIFQHRIKEYEGQLSGDFERFIYDEFIQNFESLKSVVSLYLAIRNYPREFKEDILGKDMTKCMDYFNVEGKTIEMDSSAEESYKDRATVFLNDSNIGFVDTLKYVSGAFPFELDIVLNKKKNLSSEDIEEILKKFSELFEKNSAEKDRVAERRWSECRLTSQKNSFVF